MRLLELLRSTTFRWTLAIAAAVAACNLFLFGCFYLRTTMYLTGNIDTAITEAAALIADGSKADTLAAIARRLRDDPRRVKLAGLFAADGQRLAGNIAAMPAGLPVDGTARGTVLQRIDGGDEETQTVRAVAVRAPSGEVVVIGRNVDEMRQVANTVGRGIVLQLVPGLILALVLGAWLSVRAQRRVEEMRTQASRIMSGELQARLPMRQSRDSLDRLAIIVNRMLDEIEMLVRALAGVGDDIAHDIRTPLTRVRAMLERGRDAARDLGELQAVTDRAIAGLDQSRAMITALLRIAEIDHGRRLAAMDTIRLSDILHAVVELYEPIAEDKGVRLHLMADDMASIRGDRDLIFEAVANLVDNAVKFTPPGGAVRIAVRDQGAVPVIRVADTGPGIPPEERENVVRRFYRSDKSRPAQGGAQGFGLGLSLVAAIVKLHGFQLDIGGGPGCVVRIVCGEGVAPDVSDTTDTDHPVRLAAE